MAHYPDQDIATATPADLAADMSYHRKTYHGFLSLLRWAAIGSGVLLIIVFFVLQSVPVERTLGGDPPPGVAEGPIAATPGGA